MRSRAPRRNRIGRNTILRRILAPVFLFCLLLTGCAGASSGTADTVNSTAESDSAKDGKDSTAESDAAKDDANGTAEADAAISDTEGTDDTGNTDTADSTDTTDSTDKLQVVCTIFPQYDFVREIAGDAVELTMLLKPGEETHSFDPTPQDIITISNADVFIYVGGENDAWVEEILDSIENDNLELLRLVDCVETVEEETVEGMKEERGHSHEDSETESDTQGETGTAAGSESETEEGNEAETAESDEDSEQEIDEHVWTSPVNAMEIVSCIAELLSGLDAENAALYSENAAAYIGELEELDAQFREVVESAESNLLIFGDRFPFRYFADEYGLDYYAAFSGCASDTEPSAATMAFLINKVEETNAPVILKMELSNENIANAIAETTGAEVMTLYSCHNVTAEQFAAGETYLSMMQQNVETLKEALNGWH